MRLRYLFHRRRQTDSRTATLIGDYVQAHANIRHFSPDAQLPPRLSVRPCKRTILHPYTSSRPEIAIADIILRLRICVIHCASVVLMNETQSVSQSVDMANLLIPHCSFTVPTVHLPNHIISLISLFIPLFTLFCVVLFTTCVSFCTNYLLSMLIMFILGLL